MIRDDDRGKRICIVPEMIVNYHEVPDHNFQEILKNFLFHLVDDGFGIISLPDNGIDPEYADQSIQVIVNNVISYIKNDYSIFILTCTQVPYVEKWHTALCDVLTQKGLSIKPVSDSLMYQKFNHEISSVQGNFIKPFQS